MKLLSRPILHNPTASGWVKKNLYGYINRDICMQTT